jgi:hypothetical protein
VSNDVNWYHRSTVVHNVLQFYPLYVGISLQFHCQWRGHLQHKSHKNRCHLPSWFYTCLFIMSA